MRETASVVGVEVRHDNPANVVRRKAERLQLRADLLLRLYPLLESEPEVGVPARELARVVDVSGFARVDHDQALGMLDQPGVDRERLGPAAVHQRQCQARPAPAHPLPLASPYGDRSSLNGM